MKITSDHRVGDKIRLKSGLHAGLRGNIQGATGELVSVILPTGDVVETSSSHLTNYSLAARNAWANMPKRAGRPARNGRKKRMLSLRLDEDILELLDLAVARGLIPDKTTAISGWLRLHLQNLMPDSQTVTPPADHS